jgi:hypothetical protein
VARYAVGGHEGTTVCGEGYLSKIGDWLAQRVQADLDEHVRPEIQALIKRGDVTPAEVAGLACNPWEWEALVPAMNDEAFIKHVEHALANCAIRRRPFVVYDEAVVGLHAPELLKRFKARWSQR